MNETLETTSGATITNNLINALAQSQALVQQLEDQTRINDHFRQQNDQLRQEVETLRNAQQSDARHDRFSDQLEQFFKKDIEKQAEIDFLKKQLVMAQRKEREWRQQNPGLPSPLVSSDDVVAVPSSSPLRSPSSPTRCGGATYQVSSPLSKIRAQHSSPPRKRVRTASPTGGPLAALSNGLSADRKIHGKAKGGSIRGEDAIPIVTEDGEDHNRSDDMKVRERKPSEKREPGASKRLDALLSTPTPGNALLTRPEMSSSKSMSPIPRTRAAPTLSKSSGDLAKDAAVPQERPKSRFLPPKRRPVQGPEDDEPLRCRPVNRLNLSHFKLNPNVNNGYDYAFEGTVRNRAERKCLSGCTRSECCGGQMEALAATLGPNAKLSDDDLLIYLLGPGSEDRIRGLTSVARENLVHEAQAKRVADTYGKMHRNLHQRAQSPTGFWNSDMPGSQEEVKNREDAKQRERDEVQKRYREACKDNGKWVFADE